MRGRAWVLAALLLLAAPGVAHAQMFLASRPDPPFAIGPLFVRAAVTPALGPVMVDVLFSVDVPPGRSMGGLQQDLYLAWPGGVAGEPGLGAPDRALEQTLAERGFTVVDSGRLALRARNLYARRRDGQSASEPIAGGAPFVTFVREGGALGLSAPATLVRLPWDPRFANRVYLIGLRLSARGLLKQKPATWVEHALWGARHRLSLSFHEIRHRAVFPLYLQMRDRVVRLGDEPAQIIVNFAEADRLKVDELFPQSARRALSETLDNTEQVSLFLDRADGITPQVLTVQFGYFTGLQSWAPVLIPALFFVLGNVAAVLIRNLAERLSKRWSGKVLVGRAAAPPPARQQGVVLERSTLDDIVPGVTRYEDVLRLCGRDVEEQWRVAEPHRRLLTYRGRRLVPDRRPLLGWLAAVDHWDLEQHEVEIELDREVVRDVQARVRRSRVSAPEPR